MSNTLTPIDVGLSPDFMRRTAPELARDIVLKLDTAAKLAAERGLSPFQWDTLRQWPAFVQMVKNAHEDLGGIAGTVERARRSAQLAVAEYAVTDMVGIMGNPKAREADRIAATEVLMEIGGMTTQAQRAAASAAPGAAVNYGGGSLINFVSPGQSREITEAPIDAAAAAVSALEKQKAEAAK
jgi:hypothetical protein